MDGRSDRPRDRLEILMRKAFFLMLLLLGAPARAQETASPLERLEAENAVLRHEMKELAARVAALEKRLKTPEGEPEVLDLARQLRAGTDEKGADRLIREYEIALKNRDLRAVGELCLDGRFTAEHEAWFE